MTSINTSVDFLEHPHDPMDERTYASPWNRAYPILPTSHLDQNSFAENGSVPQFAPTSQAPRLPGSGTPFGNSIFQCTNWESSQRQAVQGHTSIFQRANMNRDISEQVFMQSNQCPLRTSQALSSYEDSQNNVLHKKQQETVICNENNTSYGDALTSSQPIAKRIPVFKTTRGKASSIPEKGKKRLVSPSQEEPIKKHSGLPLFSHSQKSAFKPVSKVGIKESAGNSYLLPTPEKENCENDSVNQLKTQPLKPKFGKSHHCPNKKIKNEKDPDLTHHKVGGGNNEASDATLSNKTGKRSEIRHGSQTDTDSPPIKDESNNDEDNIDVIGTSDIENDSELEDLLALTPIQCPIAGKMIQMKKNLSTTVKNKIKQLPRSKGNKKLVSELNQDKKVNQSQDMKGSRKKMIPVIKAKKENLSQPVKNTNSQCQPPKGGKKKSNLQEISNTKKKTSFNDCDTKPSSLTEMHLKTKKKIIRSSSSSSSRHQTMKHGPYIQKGESTYESYTDYSNQEITVSEDSSESILQSSTSHDSSKRSSDLTFSRLSPEPSANPIAAQENALDREIAHDSNKNIKKTTRNANEEITDFLDSSRHNRKTTGNENEETTSLSETVKERVMQLLNSVDEDLWVQCDRCLKWRKLIQIIDPATLPDKWYCTMLPFPGKNSCEEPEEEWQETDRKYVYYEHQFVIGSVVWAQVPGTPWWPAMVDIDPDYRRYDWFNSTWTYPTSYHVTFFGEPVTRAWVTCRNIKVFKQHDTYRKFLNDGKKDPTRDIVLRKAVQEACHAISMEVQHRRKTYTFVTRYTGKIGKSPDKSHSGPSSSTQLGEREQEKDSKNESIISRKRDLYLDYLKGGEETHNMKTPSPIKMTLAQRKQQQEAKQLHSTASTFAGQPSSAQKHFTIKEAKGTKGTSSEKSEEISDSGKEMHESDQNLDSKNSHIMSHTQYDENEEQFDSFNSEFVGRNQEQDDTHEGKTDNMSNDEDTGDDQNYTDHKEHNQNPYDTAYVDEKHDNESSSYEEYHIGTDVSHAHSDNESSPERYDNERSHEQLHTEDSCKTHAWNKNKGTGNSEEQDDGDYDQDGNEDKCEELDNTGYDYEQDNDYEILDNEKKCNSQKNYDDKGDDEQYNEETYEKRDKGDDCESQKTYNNGSNYGQHNGETYERHNSRGDCEVQNYESNDDVEYENEDVYDEQDNIEYEDNKGNIEKQKYFEEQDNTVCEDSECSSEEQNDYEELDNCGSEEGESDCEEYYEN
uniref:CW-type domain-containing protein n=1 Tax=Scylla olivacea TaxID=85551 RepID=A0A0P4W8J7_SCYOL